MNLPAIAALRRLYRARSGNVTVIFAVAVIPLLVSASIAVDMIKWSDQQTRLQATADAAATAAAREFQLPKADTVQMASIVAAVVAAEYAHEGGDRGQKISIATHFDVKQQSAEVDLTQPVRPSIYSAIHATVVGATSVARAVNGGTICVIGLNRTGIGVVSLTNFASLDAVNCSVYANSRNPAAIMSLIDAKLNAQLTCSAGGAIGVLANYKPRPQTDCPQLEDPLKDRPAPPFSGCDHINTAIKGGAATLDPGVYCGGLTVSGAAQVTVNPGIYIIKDGPLDITGSARFAGYNVGFYLVGKTSVLTFDRNTEISLTAPRDGPLAGLLIFEDHDAPKTRVHRILSDNARMLLGTIYLPRGNLLIDAFKPIADQSAYTAIVVGRLILKEGPKLVLNANYSMTDIPVPDGIGPISGKVVLVK